MSSNNDSQKRFDELLCLVVEEQATTEQITELLDIAEHDAELKHKLKAQLEIDFLLSQVEQTEQKANVFVDAVLQASASESQIKDFEKQVIGAIQAEADAAKQQALRQEQQNQTPIDNKVVYLPWAISGFSMAACVLLSVLFFFYGGRPITVAPMAQVPVVEVEDNGVAVVVNTVANKRDYRIGQTISPGKLKIEQGFMELEFYNGAQLKIAGPAELEVISAQRVKLLSGKVMTDVPHVAIGFTIDTPNSEVVDLGTAIGVSVDENGQSQVHVFDGLIEAVDKDGNKQQIAKGEALNIDAPKMSEWQQTKAKAGQFSEFSEIADLTVFAIDQKHQRWLEMRDLIIQEPSLVAYYDFEKDSSKPRILKNVANTSEEFNGAIVGAKWAAGPWPGKSSLDFKRSSDRVRVDIDGRFDEFTLAAWVKIDSLDRTFSALLLTDGYRPGDMHWQLGQFGQSRHGLIVLGLAATLEQKGAYKGRNYNYAPFFSVADSGTWYHLATSVSQNSKEVKTYINGELVKRQPLLYFSDFWRIEKANIANWNSKKNANPLRNLNGSMAEMMIFSRALGDDEVAQIALKD
ncbi:hypothetical protein C2869_09610 [Saccharobesus litoralis]|uniref:FecR protein domain-containing protein n=1 Tax=Saccharobesus litoralis TaxID=2172099 RepID=A0A2S0VRF7_9ALTE|nr:LamG-like jellyroll fold domain-containing protein [Saccharobesus litoralis]AWB66670.1 hypothetical protein C2869_09610 [Saccharobesus litoralis]